MSTVQDAPGLSADVRCADATWEPRVLVVDDDNSCRLAATGLLQTLGLAVDEAADGVQALEMSAGWPYVAIFMDCGMPGVDGYTAARRLRAREGRNAHTPVIAMTAKSRSISLASGMDHHVSKPLELDLLRADCQNLHLVRRDDVPLTGAVAHVLREPLLDPDVFSEAPSNRMRAARAGNAFVEHAGAQLPELWRLTNAGDGPSLQRLTQSLRLKATNAGTPRVAELCDRLNRTSPYEASILAADVEPRLRVVLMDTAAAIRAYGEHLPSPGGSAFRRSDPIVPYTSGSEPIKAVRVALADDDPLARIAIGAMLRHADWLELVGSAASVEEVVHLVSVTRPDVVVLDWLMPGGGGREAARRIVDRAPGTLIVALTASDSLEALAEMTSAGVTCLVAKGGSAGQLTETIARALKASAAARAAEQHKRTARRGIGSGIGRPEAPRGESPLDEAGVRRLWTEFGTTGILTELVDMFGSETPVCLSDMRRANDAGDATAVSAGAHQLKGGCLTLAAVHMAEVCGKLETMAVEGSLDGAAQLIDQIESDFERAYAALTAMVVTGE